MKAPIKGHTEVVKLFLTHPNIDVNIQNKNGDTVVMVASSNGCTEIVKLLMSHPNIDVTLKNENGLDAVELASRSGNTDIVETLLTHKNNHAVTLVATVKEQVTTSEAFPDDPSLSTHQAAESTGVGTSATIDDKAHLSNTLENTIDSIAGDDHSNLKLSPSEGLVDTSIATVSV